MYQLLIPAALQSAVAAGSVGLMTTTTGATTTLVAANGAIVGTATLIEAGALGGGSAAVGGVAAGLVWPIALGAIAAVGIGALVWWLVSEDEPQEAEMAIIEFDATAEDALQILREAEEIVAAESGRVNAEGRVELKRIA